MHGRSIILALLLFAPAAHAVDPSELKPGLVVTYSGLGDDGVITVTRLEPTVAYFIGVSEAPHPRLNRLRKAEWKGYVNVVRRGTYTFVANTNGGDLELTVNGKRVVASGEWNPHNPPKDHEVELEGGVVPFEATFTVRGVGGPLVELLWQGPGFRMEPLPHQFLGHLPKERPAQFTKDVQLEHGRFLFEELACVRCHKPAEPKPVKVPPNVVPPDPIPADVKMARGIADRPGPNLTDVARRAYPGWIDAWLADPQKLRPHTTMPQLFAADETGRAERYAVVRYLTSLAGGILQPPPRGAVVSNELRQSLERGRVLFTVTGCAACHNEPLAKKPRNDADEDKPPLKPEEFFYSLGTAGPAAKYALGAVGSKTRPEPLAAFLQNPLKTHPGGRMPQMNLTAAEAMDIARHLCRVSDEAMSPEMPDGKGLKPGLIALEVFKAHGTKPGELDAFIQLPTVMQWAALGEKLMVTKGCVNCHTVEANGKPLEPRAKFPPLADIRKPAEPKGCLSNTADPATTPVYKLGAAETAAVAAFIKDGLTGSGFPAPLHSARVALRRFNCLNCHSKDGEGGIPVELADSMRLLEKAENVDDVRPPLLTGIGHKARTAWLKSVLTQGGRARPWMQLRMPQYGEAHVGHLPEGLAGLEGLRPDDAIAKLPLTPAVVQAGKEIVGKGGFGCISCHDISGVPNTGTRGPDLATINQRVRYEWYDRWLHQPLRMAPGTRMPQAFVDNKSTLAAVLDADPKAQAEAMWAYLSLGPGLPLPDGMEPPKGLIIAVKDRPEILRTFMPDAGTKAVVVGYPGAVSVAFSADQCRLAYAWAGNFLDASPVWNNRGGAPAKLLGPRFWTAPPGHPWGLTTNPAIPPDFLTRANNPAFGTPLPLEPARVYDGPLAVGFDGYTLDRAGRPTFRYHYTGNPDAVLKVQETPVPLKTGVAAGFRRQFQVEVPGGYQAWLLAGITNKPARLTNGTVTADVAIPTAGNRVILPTDTDGATVLEATGAPEGTAWWFVRKPGGGWLALLRLPESNDPQRVMVTLTAWGLPKDDDSLIKGLTSK